MPRTPMAVRPVARTSVSLKQTAMPRCVPMKICSSPAVCRTVISWSPSSSVSARMPLERMFFSAACSMRLTVPLRVTKTR